MVFTRRTAALAAVVLIPLGVAAAGYALSDSPARPTAPSRAEPDSGSPTPSATDPSGRTGPTPGEEVVDRPPVTDSPADDDDGDGPDDDGHDDGVDGPDDDGHDDGVDGPDDGG
ncbi:small secreted hydrophilic protein [Streptomyces prasinus]|uniref:small secreted hydrophilic protein n=1 Tax=Streptomyces prasinus TaxID=67345 RepID=UPI0036CB85CB